MYGTRRDAIRPSNQLATVINSTGGHNGGSEHTVPLSNAFERVGVMELH
jgi:hypothetical protein